MMKRATSTWKALLCQSKPANLTGRETSHSAACTAPTGVSVINNAAVNTAGISLNQRIVFLPVWFFRC